MEKLGSVFIYQEWDVQIPKNKDRFQNAISDAKTVNQNIEHNPAEIVIQ